MSPPGRMGPGPVPSGTPGGPTIGPSPLPRPDLSQFTRHGPRPSSGGNPSGSTMDTVGPGAGGGSTGSAGIVGLELREADSCLTSGAGGGVATGAWGAIGGARSQMTVGPEGVGKSPDLSTGTSRARARAAPCAAIDTGRSAARRAEPPARGADTTKSSQSLPVIAWAPSTAFDTADERGFRGGSP